MQPSRQLEQDILLRYGLIANVAPFAKHETPFLLPGSDLDKKFDFYQLPKLVRPLL